MKSALRMLGVVCLCAALVLAGVWFYSQRGAAKLTWQKPEVKKSVHTFAYKVYSNPRLSEGRFFLSKIVLKNEGKQPVRDFSISYQVPDYISQTTPETLPEIPPGNTVIKLFYPQLPERVTQMRDPNLATLEIKLQWKEDGTPREEVLRENFQFRGVNEFEYTDLPAEEIVTEYDASVNAELLAAMVTPNDPVVAEFAAAITERLGGAVAGLGGAKEAEEVLRGTYEYMAATGMRYAGAKGVPENIGDVSTLVQTIRLPRDVILSNNGLCIELALLWASVLEHLGIRSYIDFVPGHAFIAAVAGGQFYTVECTAITPKAVGKQGPVSFEQAVAMSAEVYLRHRKDGSYFQQMDVRALQEAGIRPPELPSIDIDKVKSILASRKPGAPRPEMPQARGVSPAPQNTNVRTTPKPQNTDVKTAPPPDATANDTAPTEAGSGGLTALALAKEGNRYVGDQSKNHVVQIRSERSAGTLEPSVWYIVYYDPDAAFKAIEVKFGSGKKLDISHPWRMIEPITGETKELDGSKLKVDSDKALSIAISQPLMKGLTAKATQFLLQRGEESPVWKIHLWVAKISHPGDMADIGDVYVATKDGTVTRTDLHINNAE